MEAARRMIDAIVNPPQAEVGAVYRGTVVNITKFGAFVNILPGRDGLIHISKLGGGRRIDRVEDVLSLGDELDVRVDDIDPNGKLSLSLLGGEGPDGGGGDGDGGRPARAPRGESASDDADDDADAGGAADRVSFEDSWDDEARELYGDLGSSEEGRGGEGRGGDRDRRPPRRRRR
jgi:polyribonucleotide nucleotidyltransferase